MSQDCYFWRFRRESVSLPFHLPWLVVFLHPQSQRYSSFRSHFHSAFVVILPSLTLILWPLSSVQSLSHVQLFATPWTEACQASLSITNSRSLLKQMSVESVMPSNHLVLCHPFLLLPSIFLSIRVYSIESVRSLRESLSDADSRDTAYPQQTRKIAGSV